MRKSQVQVLVPLLSSTAIFPGKSTILLALVNRWQNPHLESWTTTSASFHREITRVVAFYWFNRQHQFLPVHHFMASITSFTTEITIFAQETTENPRFPPKSGGGDHRAGHLPRGRAQRRQHRRERGLRAAGRWQRLHGQRLPGLPGVEKGTLW